MESEVGSIHSGHSSYIVEEVEPQTETTAPLEVTEENTSDTPLQPNEEQQPQSPKKDEEDPESLQQSTTIAVINKEKTLAPALKTAAALKSSSWLGISSDMWFWIVLVVVTIAGVLILYFVQKWWVNRQAAERDVHRKKAREEFASTILMDLDTEKAVEPMPANSSNKQVPTPQRTVTTTPQSATPSANILTAIPTKTSIALETPRPKGFEVPKKVTFVEETAPKSTPKVTLPPQSILKPVVITPQTVTDVDKVLGSDGSWTVKDIKQCVHGVEAQDASIKKVENQIINDCNAQPSLAALISSVFSTPIIKPKTVDEEPSHIEEIKETTEETLKESPEVSLMDEKSLEVSNSCDEETCPIPVKTETISQSTEEKPKEEIETSSPDSISSSPVITELEASPNEDKDSNLNE
jgi:hypothetical protein